MGWAIAAAIGGRLAAGAGRFVCLTGDGSMRMMAQEIATAARYRVPLILVVVNNAGYGSVSLRAPDEAHNRRIGALERVDWAEFARLLGGEGCGVRRVEDVGDAIRAGLACDGPFLIDLHLPRAAARETAADGFATGADVVS